MRDLMKQEMRQTPEFTMAKDTEEQREKDKWLAVGEQKVFPANILYVTSKESQESSYEIETRKALRSSSSSSTS